jgi:hypothetical protein
MEGVYSELNQLITDHISEAFPRNETNKVISRLLSGESYTQIVGRPQRVLDVTAHGVLDVMEEINEKESRGEEIVIYAHGKRFAGQIENEPSWSETSFQYFTGSFTVLVRSERRVR